MGDFELRLPTYSAFEIEVDMERAADVLGSVTLVRRNGTVVGPTVLYAPKTAYSMPTLTLIAEESKVHTKGTVTLKKASSDTRVVDVILPGKSTDNQILLNGIAYTTVRGTKMPLKGLKTISDDTIFVNSEGVFLVNVIEKTNANGIKKDPNVGVREGQSTSQNVINASGLYQIVTARG